MIVITTPTGDIGGQVLDRLLDRASGTGEPVRVVARDPRRLERRVRDRVEVVTGSHDDPEVLTTAFAGADTVLWVVPPDPRTDDPLRHYLGFAEAAAAAIGRQGVRRVVAVSSLGRTYVRDAGLLTPAFAMDGVLERTGAHLRTLRMPYFLENLLNQVEAISGQGVLVMPNAADRPLATVATRDIAAAAVDLLLDPTWTGQDSVAVIGPDAPTPTEMARVVSEVLHRRVRLQPVDGEAYGAQLQQYGMSEAWARGLVDMAAAQDDGIYDAEQRATTPAPTGFRQWCEDVLAPAVLEARAREVRTAFAHLRDADPVLAGLIDRQPDYDADAWLRDLPVLDLFGTLVFQVVGQQISVTASRAILDRLTRPYGGRMPQPEEVARLDADVLRAVGMSRRKAATVLDLAARFADGRLSEERLSVLSDDEVVAELTQVTGIGPWTVHGALLIALRRPDVVATGDGMLRSSVRTAYGLDHLPTEQEVRDIAAVWSPYGSLGANLLFAAFERDAARRREDVA